MHGRASPNQLECRRSVPDTRVRGGAELSNGEDDFGDHMPGDGDGRTVKGFLGNMTGVRC